MARLRVGDDARRVSLITLFHRGILPLLSSSPEAQAPCWDSAPREVRAMDSPARSVEGRFAGRTLIVTGCGNGIGRATALRAAREGAAVVVSDILQDAALGVVAEIASLGGRATAHV